jgi:hypothetical protein
LAERLWVYPPFPPYIQTFIDRGVHDSVKARLPLSLEEKFVFELQPSGSLLLKSRVNTLNLQELRDLLDSFSTPLLNVNGRFIPLKFDCEIEGPQGASRTEQLVFSEIEILYVLMFYMSTLARYRPHIWDAALSGKEKEYVTLFKKFLYYADNKFIGVISARVSRLE